MLIQLNVSAGGMPKMPVKSARVARSGIEGDKQHNLKYHGGPDRAVCLFSEELYEELRDAGIQFPEDFAGSIGENFTTRGLDHRKLAKGDRLKVGQCVIELTDVRVPCNQLRAWDSDLPELIVGRSGWVARVITEGVVLAGDQIEVLPRA